MTKHLKYLAAVVLILLSISACSIVQKPIPTITPTLTPTATSTITPTATFTPSPTTTHTPTFTASPTPTKTATVTMTPTKAPNCNANNVLKNLKSTINYDEYTILYNKKDGISTLMIWLIDPEIDPKATGEKITANVNLAIRYAVKVSYHLISIDSCVSYLFNFINTIIVDQNYNGWFSGLISPKSLPKTEPTDIQQLDEIGKQFTINYSREKPTAPKKSAPAGSCTWREAKEKIHWHFAPDRENIGFYFVLDDTSASVWGEWDVPAGLLLIAALPSLLNIIQEIQCLHPTPDRLVFILTDEKGTVLMIGILPQSGIENMDLNKLQITYQE